MRPAGPRWLLLATISMLGAALLAAPAGAARAARPAVQLYDVDGVRDSLDRSAVVATGAAILEVDHAAVLVSASASDLRKLERLRYKVTRHATAKPSTRWRGMLARAAGFPAADANYHSYQEMSDETLAAANDYPSLVQRTQIGTSYGGRAIWALKLV